MIHVEPDATLTAAEMEMIDRCMQAATECGYQEPLWGALRIACCVLARCQREMSGPRRVDDRTDDGVD